jgi:CRISPR-associated endoribonuclease Cas6
MVEATLKKFVVSNFRITLAPRELIRLPRENKGITLRGAFGSAFRALVCVDRNALCDQCAMHATCPYGFIFAPRVPPEAKRLRLNRDIPRPFVIKPPLDQGERYEPDDRLCFDLVLVGKARDFIPYFLVSLRELGERGIGVGRGRFDIEQVEILDCAGSAQTVYHKCDPVVRLPDSAIRYDDFAGSQEAPLPEAVTVQFLTPVLIKQDGRWVPPVFGPLLRRLRDRIQALAYFYCGETLDMDFIAFGKAADAIKCTHQDLRWAEESRYSRHRDLRHTLKGFVGAMTFEGDLEPFLPFLRIGQYVHVGKAAVFGQGWYRLERHKA